MQLTSWPWMLVLLGWAAMYYRSTLAPEKITLLDNDRAIMIRRMPPPPPSVPPPKSPPPLPPIGDLLPMPDSVDNTDLYDVTFTETAALDMLAPTEGESVLNTSLKRGVKRRRSSETLSHNIETEKESIDTDHLVAIDESEDYSNLAHAFRQRLFPKDCSDTLSKAYSERDATVQKRKQLRKNKRVIVSDLKALREQFYAKKIELLEMNSSLKANSKKLGGWNRKVFDLELQESCPWNDKLQKLRDYVDEHGKPPETNKRKRGTAEEKMLATFIASVKHKVNNHNFAKKYPHRAMALEDLGVNWGNEHEAKFEMMFQKLVDYKKEHGTLKIPSLKLCQESGCDELVKLHNWIFTQVSAFRYQLPTKTVEIAKRFLDIGFTFERWYATNTHVFERSDLPKFDDIIRRYVQNGGKMSAEDVEVVKAHQALNSPKKKKKMQSKGKEKEEDQKLEPVRTDAMF
ncbi:hypothetical protein ACHAXM_009570 [Skeletonema potamos]